MKRPEFNLSRRLVAEALGTMLLVATVIGSGIMGEQLADGNAAIALLGNTIATGSMLIVLITIFGPISGAHFNPLVSLYFLLQKKLPRKDFVFYTIVQILGGISGTFLAHMMFGLPLISASTHARTGVGVWMGEVVATFGLLLAIVGCLKSRPEALPYAVGLFITAGYWFTSSTSFANPAVTIARALTDTFSGIQPANMPGFILAQLVGCFLAVGMFRWLREGFGEVFLTNKLITTGGCISWDDNSLQIRMVA